MYVYFDVCKSKPCTHTGKYPNNMKKSLPASPYLVSREAFHKSNYEILYLLPAVRPASRMGRLPSVGM